MEIVAVVANGECGLELPSPKPARIHGGLRRHDVMDTLWRINVNMRFSV